MFNLRRPIYLKCPVCGHEDKAFRPQDRNSVTCPKCQTRLRLDSALFPGLLMGLIFGALLAGIGVAIFFITNARPVYAILGAGTVLLPIALLLSSWLRRFTVRWTKA